MAGVKRRGNRRAVGDAIALFLSGLMITAMTTNGVLFFDFKSNTNTNNLANAQIDNSGILIKQAENISSLSKNNNTLAVSKQNQEALVPNRQITLEAEDADVEIAPGKRVKVWTFNGTVPAPTIRLSEGENVTIKFINKSPIPHTIHFHGNHDDTNDGVVPQIMPNETYLYNITGDPAGALMYHCHAPPTSLHIRMGMYGALIVDPKDKPLPPAMEFVMVMSEYDLEDQLGFEADYYLINGYADKYMRNPLTINHGDLIRLYLINMGTTIPYPFHLHSTTFLAYPSGLWGNEPQQVQTISIAPGDASIVEAKWKYPGTYLFHSHGIQEERGNMGQINVIGTSGTYGDKNVKGDVHHDGNLNANSTTITNEHSSNASVPLTESVSMFDWQYELQKKLQKPQVINYTEEQPDLHGKDALSESRKMQERGEDLSLKTDKTLATNITIANNSDSNKNNTNATDATSTNTSSTSISIVPGSGTPGSKVFFKPSPAKIAVGSTITWSNDDTLPRTVTSGNPEKGPDGIFDSGIMNADISFSHTFDKAGVSKYYCAVHPWMIGTVMVQ
jgi:nitrite reductase (NO-forming)